MEAFLAKWGTELLFSLITAAILGWAKWRGNKLKKEKDQTEENARVLADQQLNKKIDTHIEIELEPIYQELEDLR
jgi:hypothetical protein